MRIIDVLNMVAEGEIKEGTKLVIGGNVYSYIDTYTDDSGCSFVNEEGYSDTFLEDEEKITQPFLNLEVELIPPKPKKYYLRLYEDDSFSYINKNKIGCTDYKTKFTQEEIDGSMLLKFIERHGIKEEVSD